MPNLEHCVTTENNRLCTPDSNFIDYESETCLLNLVKGKEVENVCTFWYQKGLVADFRRVEKEWVGSIQQDMEAEEICDKGKNRKLELKAGVNSVPLRFGCRVIAKSFVLPKFEIRGLSEIDATLLYPPYSVSPLHHLKLDSLPELEIPKVKPFSSNEIRLLHLHEIMNNHTFAKHTKVNSGAIIFCILLILFFILFIKFRHSCNLSSCFGKKRKNISGQFTPQIPSRMEEKQNRPFLNSPQSPLINSRENTILPPTCRAPPKPVHSEWQNLLSEHSGKPGPEREEMKEDLYLEMVCKQ